MRIGIVAGEASGDLLGAGLITSLREQYPDAVFEGIAGPQMIAAGCRALFPAEKLAVMGLVEVLAHLREILKIRKQLFHHFRENPPDIFVGIDAPDFNLTLERRLREKGIKTVHYVSPSVWAWRQKRVKKIARSVDLMLVLFPFEEEFYRQHNVPVKFVGHPLADMIPLCVDRVQARDQLGLAQGQKLLALLPGSRSGEVQRLAEPFVRAAMLCKQQQPELCFIAPMASGKVRAQFENILREIAPALEVTLLDGKSREAMAAADVVLLASGTAALEAMLLKRPMVVAYILAPLTYWMLKKFRMLKVSLYSLPNLLAGREVVRECIQEDATAENLAAAVLELLTHAGKMEALQEEFSRIHTNLRRDASSQAARAVLQLAGVTHEYN